MSQTKVGDLIITRSFAAPIDRVFEAWLSREQWQAWIGPEGVDCEVLELDARVGGHYRLEMRPGGSGTIKVAGVFKAIEPPHALSFTWGAEGDSARQSMISIRFFEKAGQTEMVFSQAGLGEGVEGHRKGWDSAFIKLARHVEGANA